MRTALDWLLKNLIVRGTIRLRWPDGAVTTYHGAPGGEAGLSVRDWATVRAVVLNPSMGLGEGYMRGSIEPEQCSLYDLLDVLLTNTMEETAIQPVLAVRGWRDRMLRRLHQWNRAARSQRNVAHHYDIDGRLYRLFLDEDMQYSCAYFPTGEETLEEAQAAKKRHIARKLLLSGPGLRVLDIGCGWGGLALTLARDHGAVVTGITLSREQLDVARARAEAAGLADRVRFEMRDYRSVTESFDRVVSVGMFEHVGVGHFAEFFTTLRRVLAPDGVALLHSIGRMNGGGATDPWLTKYIFPGGYAPALSEVLPAVERSGLLATDIEILRLHYARTLRHWRTRFAANRQAIAALTDETCCRMFEFYLVGSELAFRRTGQMVFQLQLARDQLAVPLTRAYLANAPALVKEAV
jgi:cyclopropane-fatty-acyl-phospholipid synthase